MIPEHIARTCTGREWDFLQALIADASDRDPALVFADWLEEQGRDEAGQRIRLLRPQAGDLLVIWPMDTSEYAQEQARTAALELSKRLPEGIAWVVTSSPYAHLRIHDPAAMAKLGWVGTGVHEQMLLHERKENARLRAHIRDMERALLEAQLTRT